MNWTGYWTTLSTTLLELKNTISRGQGSGGFVVSLRRTEPELTKQSPLRILKNDGAYCSPTHSSVTPHTIAHGFLVFMHVQGPTNGMSMNYVSEWIAHECSQSARDFFEVGHQMHHSRDLESDENEWSEIEKQMEQRLHKIANNDPGNKNVFADSSNVIVSVELWCQTKMGSRTAQITNKNLIQQFTKQHVGSKMKREREREKKKKQTHGDRRQKKPWPSEKPWPEGKTNALILTSLHLHLFQHPSLGTHTCISSSGVSLKVVRLVSSISSSVELPWRRVHPSPLLRRRMSPQFSPSCLQQ